MPSSCAFNIGARACLCDVSTRESWVCGPPKVLKNGSCSATIALEALPFVISTEAQRSGEICVSTVPSWKCFSREESLACWPTQGDEKRLLFSNYRSLEALPFPLSSRPERSAVERSAFRRSLLGNVFRKRNHGPGPTQGDEKRLLFSNDSPWKRHLSPCHPDRSGPGFPTSRC